MHIAPSPDPRCVARAYALAFAAAAALAAQPAPLGEPFLVNQTTTGNQREPRVGMSANGTFVVIWESEHDDAGDIRFRKFAPDGTPFAEGQMNQTASGQQENAAIDMNLGGDFVVAWETPSTEPPTTAVRIHGRRSASGGTILGQEFEISGASDDDAEEPAVSRDATGAFAVAWRRQAELFLRGFDAGGAAAGPEAPTGLEQASDRFDVTIGPGQFVDLGYHAGGLDGVFRRPHTLAGVATGPEQPLTDAAAAQLLRPRLAGHADGVVAAWEQGVPDGIRARRFDRLSREPLGEEIEVSAPGGVSIQEPRLAAADDGAFVVTWQENLGGSLDVLAREFHRDGRPLGPPYVVNTVTAGPQFESDVAVGRSRFVVAWQSNGEDGELGGIVARIFRRRSVFADGFEAGDSQSWSATIAN